ncbi:hypothetical protein M0R45_003279 [Rubus argutus]|uniref:Uncharacterized protein n=1 Tax=Rubus argutus TaxID=59490 RepID=A0AAW1YHG0_RUBAR
MFPQKFLSLARGRGRASDDRRVHRLRREGCATMKKKSRVTKKVKKTTKKLEGDNNKSLYLCSLEHHEGGWVAYVVLAIKVSDLLSSDDELQLRQVAYKAGVDLPGSVGCGVLGSQILFAGGLKPSVPGGEEAVWHRSVYAFETDPSKRERDDDIITKMDASLLGAKSYPFMVELGGKLYALSCRRMADPPEFEVFDPKVGSWLALPQPPFFHVNARYYHAPFSYAIAGTKMFVSTEKCPVFCFDVAHPNGEWRLVPTMCGGGSFPYFDHALVLDLPADDRKKLMFTYGCSTHLQVYLMSLDDNQESVTQIGRFKLPMWPYELGSAAASDLVHLGVQKACLVITHFIRRSYQGPTYEPGTHKTQGVAIPFQFEFDSTKDKKNCFTLQFMPPRIFKYRTNPSVYPNPERVGCFAL